MKMLLMIPVLAVAAGCATTQIAEADAKPVPVDRVYFKGATPEPPAVAQVIFVRDTGFRGGGVYKHVSINGVRSASLNPGEKWTVTLPAGEYIFGVVATNIFNRPDFSIDQQLQAGRTYTYRILGDTDYSTRIHRVLP